MTFCRFRAGESDVIEHGGFIAMLVYEHVNPPIKFISSVDIFILDNIFR